MTGLLAAFMSGVAANVTAFNTVVLLRPLAGVRPQGQARRLLRHVRPDRDGGRRDHRDLHGLHRRGLRPWPRCRLRTPRPHPDRRSERQDLLHRRMSRLARPERGRVYVYDTATNTFSTGAPMLPGRDRGAGGVAVAGGKIYIAGGVHDGTTVAWFDVYDTSHRHVGQPAGPPAPTRPLPGRVVAAGSGPSAAGVSSSSTRVGYNEAFDFAAGRWLTGFAPLPTLRAASRPQSSAPKSWSSAARAGGRPQRREAYDTAPTPGGRWRPCRPRHGIQAAMWNGAAYIAAGGTRMGGGGPPTCRKC